jgi:hypothetical protein
VRRAVHRGGVDNLVTLIEPDDGSAAAKLLSTKQPSADAGAFVLLAERLIRRRGIVSNECSRAAGDLLRLL